MMARKSGNMLVPSLLGTFGTYAMTMSIPAAAIGGLVAILCSPQFHNRRKHINDWNARVAKGQREVHPEDYTS